MKDYPNDIVKGITEFLFIGREPENLRPANLVLVLGSDLIDETIEALNKIYKAGKIRDDAIVIFTGATGSLNAGKEKESIAMERYARENYSFPFAVIREEKATNLYENFSFSLDIIREHFGSPEKADDILCIGKAFALRRAQMGAASLGYPLDKLQFYGTVDSAGWNIGPDCWWQSPEATKRVMAELMRIDRYYNEGFLSILEKRKNYVRF